MAPRFANVVGSTASGKNIAQAHVHGSPSARGACPESWGRRGLTDVASAEAHLERGEGLLRGYLPSLLKRQHRERVPPPRGPVRPLLRSLEGPEGRCSQGGGLRGGRKRVREYGYGLQFSTEIYGRKRFSTKTYRKPPVFCSYTNLRKPPGVSGIM